MSSSQYFLPNLMDMGSLLQTILGAILNYKRVPMSTLNGPLLKQILTVAHMITGNLGPWFLQTRWQLTEELPEKEVSWSWA